MGGHSAGDWASRMVIEALNELSPAVGLGFFAQAVRARLHRVNCHLQAQASRQAGGSVIGSTVAVLIARQRHCVYLWAGDSRVYRYRQGQLRCLTRDHSLVAEFARQGQADLGEDPLHPNAYAITRAVGAAEEIAIDAELVEIEAGDVFLLCSDGLNRELDEQAIQSALTLPSPGEAVDTLVGQALGHGARDNTTVVVARVDPREPGSSPDYSFGQDAGRKRLR